MFKRISAIALLAATVFAMGCNTVEGAGKDMEKGGEHVQDAAKDTKAKM